MNMTYAGIGSRETPPEILELMKKLAERLGQLGFTLRSGGAKGADTAFERGVLGKHSGEIYYVDSYGCFVGFDKEMNTYKAAAINAGMELFREYHPAPYRCSDYAAKLHCRNAFILLGADLPNSPDPVDFIICWTKDGGATGGTGQALRIANAYHIPVFNLFFPDAITRLGEFLKSKKIPGLK